MLLTPFDTTIIVIYFAAMLLIGVAVMKRASKNLDSYFLAGHALPWWVLGISNASAMWDITGTMWLVYNLFVYGMKGTWLPWLWPTFNQVIMMAYLAGWVRRSGVLTGAEWISTRFGAGRGGELSRIVVVVFAMVNVVGFVAYTFQGMGKFSKIFLPWDLSANTYAVIVMSVTAVYVLLGGMISVVITDLVQFVIMVVCAVILAVIAMAKVSPADIAAVVPPGWGDLSFGWTMRLDWTERIPALGKSIAADGYGLFGLFFMAMVCKGMLVSAAGPAPNFDMQRILAARSSREAGMMSGVVSLCLLPRWIFVAAITALGLKYLAPEFARAPAGAQIDFELLLPWVVKSFVPAGLLGLLLSGLLAAFMSTFSAMVNSGGAYLANDFYKRYLGPGRSQRHYIAASYAAQILVLAAGFAAGYFAASVNQVTQWIVNGLWGGYTAANVLKWHWHRLNGFGYFWGMVAGIGAAMLLPPMLGAQWPAVFSDSGLGSLAAFPAILAVSLVGCVAGSLATQPEDDETLISFYKQVQPWGWWGPVHAKVVAREPGFRREGGFKRDAFNCLVAMVWQIPLWTIPVYAVFRDMRALWISIAVFAATSVILKFTWFDHVPREPAPARHPAA